MTSKWVQNEQYWVMIPEKWCSIRKGAKVIRFFS